MIYMNGGMDELHYISLDVLDWSVYLWVDPNGRDEHLAAALHDVGAGEDRGVHRNSLLNLVRLTGEAALVNLHTVVVKTVSKDPNTVWYGNE